MTNFYNILYIQYKKKEEKEAAKKEEKEAAKKGLDISKLEELEELQQMLGKNFNNIFNLAQYILKPNLFNKIKGLFYTGLDFFDYDFWE